MDVTIIKVPMDFGAGTRGSNLGPEILLNLGIINRLENLGHKLNIIDCHVLDHDESNIERTDAKYISSIVGTCENLAKITNKAIKDFTFPLTLGGDHSICMGSIAGVSKALQDFGYRLGIMYIDAHADFNTNKTSPTGNIHGQPLSACCGIGLTELTNIFNHNKKIDSKSLCIIGARDLDKEEKILLQEESVKVFTASDIQRYGIIEILFQALRYLSDKCDKIHISFDVDSMDPFYAPGTGIHIPGGLTYRETITLMEELGKCSQICSMDIVEFNPLKDINNKTGKTCVDIINHFFGETYN